MTNIEKLLVLLCMSMLIFFSVWDILTLYNTVCWELTAECVVLITSSAMCYMTITEKI